MKQRLTTNRNTLSLKPRKVAKDDTAITEAEFAAMANALTPEQQNGIIVQSFISDEEALMIANSLSPESQNNKANRRQSETQKRFRQKDNQQNVDKRNKPKLETFDTPAPDLPDSKGRKMDSMTGGRFHGAGLLGRNRKRRERQHDEVDNKFECSSHSQRKSESNDMFSRFL